MNLLNPQQCIIHVCVCMSMLEQSSLVIYCLSMLMTDLAVLYWLLLRCSCYRR